MISPAGAVQIDWHWRYEAGKRQKCNGSGRMVVPSSVRKIPTTSTLSCAEVAEQVLRELGQPAVGWGDEAILHQIAERLGWPHEGPRTSRRVLNALSKNPGPLKAAKRHCVRFGQAVRVFELQEAPEWKPSASSRVLALLDEPLTCQEVAARLGLDESTVRYHLVRLMEAGQVACEMESRPFRYRKGTKRRTGVWKMEERKRGVR